MFNIFKIDPITGNGKELKFEEFVFPAGEVSIKLNGADYAYREIQRPNVVVARIQNSDDLMKLALIRDALGRIDKNPVNLFLPYIPYARQDRVCDAGEAFSLAVLGRFVASLGFAQVTVVDPHSTVSPGVLEALGQKLVVISQLDVLNKYLAFIPTLLGAELVSPDAGSNKKTADAAGWLGKSNFIRADKLRDLTNGKIKEITVYADDLGGKETVILDDLVERGGTFVGLAKILKAKNAGKIILFVTHGIFGGKDNVAATIENLKNSGIDEIWTTDSYHRDLLGLSGGKVKVLNLMEAFFDKI